MNEEILLHARDGSVRAVTVVDDEDYAELSRYRWSLHNRGYACRGKYMPFSREAAKLEVTRAAV